MHVFKRPLEEPDQKGGQLLNQTELKIIFGNLPPIYDVHMKMLAVSDLLVIIYVILIIRYHLRIFLATSASIEWKIALFHNKNFLANQRTFGRWQLKNLHDFSNKVV